MTVYAKSAKQVLAKIKCPKLDLVRGVGHGYWYFVYDDVANKFYETESVYVPRLNDMALDRWVETGEDFVAKCEAKIAERAAEHAANPDLDKPVRLKIGWWKV